MAEGLSFEGLLAQARRVVMARWLWILVVAVVWGVIERSTRSLPITLMMNGVIAPEGPGAFLLATFLPGLVGTIGAAAMMGVVARIDQPARPALAVFRHAAIAGATVLAVLLIYGVGGMLLRDAAAYLSEAAGGESVWLAYPVAFFPPIFQFGLFAFLGMTLPAATERPVAPWTAAAVALKLSERRRVWLLLIAVVWSVAMWIPGYAVSLLHVGQSHLISPLVLLGQMLTAVGIGVLYLELRRLRGAMAAEPTADAFD